MARWFTALCLLCAALCVQSPAAPPVAEPVPLVDKPLVRELPAGFYFYPNVMDFSPDGKFLGLPDAKGNAVLWDLATWKATKTLPASTVDAGILRWSGDGKVLAIQQQDAGPLQLLDTSSWRVSKEINPRKDARGKFFSLRSVSRDGNVVVGIFPSRADDKLWIWDVKKGTRKALDVPTASDVVGVNGCAVSPDGRLVVTVAGERRRKDDPPRRPGEVKFWDAVTGKIVFSGKRSSNEAIGTVLFSHDGKRIAFFVEGGTFCLWDVARRREVLTLKGKKEDGSLIAMAFSKDGKWLLTVSSAGKVQAWDAPKGKLTKTVSSGLSSVSSARFSSDGSKVVLASGGSRRVLFLTAPKK
jgi:WD40 repeat protein